jgi:molybdopterin-biosynthesis enzyme MoeA-like protein/5'-deoxynucleotidase YfbR-like HD superfamily hydrolase
MTPDAITGILDTLRAAEALKDTPRSAHTSSGRRESTAEHSWRLCLMALLLGDALGPLDLGRLLRICVVHDLGEALHGDIPAPEQSTGLGKAVAERADLAQLLAPLPAAARDDILALWDEYEAAATPEAIAAKGLDKLETLLQHSQGANPPGFDYAFNLAYGRGHTDAHPLLACFRAVLDEATRARMNPAEDVAPMPNPTACLLIIGNEVLSGRTKDANLQFLGTRLGELGIPLREVRVIPDVPDTIVATVNDVRPRFTYVFTTGGIGPTHDDITAECVAAAFGVPWEPHPEAMALLAAHYASREPPVEFNAARQRMAAVPRGATLIANPVSVAPGFIIGNVHVMAGVPRIMQAMFEGLAPTLRGGTPVQMRAVHAHGLLEGRIAEGLGHIQARFPEVEIGSYPYYRETGGGVALVAKGTDVAMLDAAIAEITGFVAGMGFEPVSGEPK